MVPSGNGGCVENTAHDSGGRVYRVFPGIERRLTKKMTGMRNSGRSSWMWALAVVLTAGLVLAGPAPWVLAQDDTAAESGEAAAGAAATSPGLGAMEYVYWAAALAASIAALVQAWRFYGTMMQADDGTPRMVEIAGYVRDGASA